MSEESKQSSRRKKGVSGNTDGRPPGLKDKYTVLRKQLEKFTPKLMVLLDQMLDEGDLVAAKLMLDRIFPSGDDLVILGRNK